jgi:hypothetical protein
MDLTPDLTEPVASDGPLLLLDDEAPDGWTFLIGVAVGAGVAALLLLAT